MYGAVIRTYVKGVTILVCTQVVEDGWQPRKVLQGVTGPVIRT